MPTIKGRELRFRFCFQFDLAVLKFDRVGYGIATVLFAEFGGFLLKKLRERVEIAGDGLSGLFFGIDESLVKLFDFFAFGGRIGALDGESTTRSSRRFLNPIDLMFWGVFCDPDALY